MKKTMIRAMMAGTFGLAILCSSFVGWNAKVGSDVVEIYLNKKLILSQVARKPVELKALPISEANAADNLVVILRKCHATDAMDKSRTIMIRDAGGKTVREWTYTGSEDNGAMIIPVREVLDLMKNAKDALTLTYSGSMRINGQKTAGVITPKKG
ncbi:MAG TPA: hypothetical protein VK666_06520 [Chryseolinea sp.]|nr:hypothetical protein [Chryseolinea sp.]